MATGKGEGLEKREREGGGEMGEGARERFSYAPSAMGILMTISTHDGFPTIITTCIFAAWGSYTRRWLFALV